MSTRTHQLIVWVKSEKARRAVISATARGSSVRFCGDMTELCVAVKGERRCRVVCELVHGRERELEQLAKVLNGLSATTPLLLCLDLRRAAAQQVLFAVQHFPRAHLALVLTERLEDEMAAFRDDSVEASAIPRLVERLLPLAPPSVRDILATAIVATRAAASVKALARLSGTPRRTLGNRLKQARMPVARELLGKLRSLHSLWDLDVLGWSPKKTATAGGYGDRNTWAKNVARHLHASHHTVLRDIGFEGLLERTVTELFSRVRNVAGGDRS